MEFNTLEYYGAIEDQKNRTKAKYHDHIFGRMGASGALACILIESLKQAHVRDMPPKNEVQKNYSQFILGELQHILMQDDTIEFFQTTKPYVGIQVGKEIYVTLTIVESPVKITIVSPIDLMYVKENAQGVAFVKKNYSFRDIKEQVLVVADGAEILQITDIKSANNIGFSKAVAGHKDRRYTGQFHLYMKPTLMSWIEVLYIDKESGTPFRTKVFYDEKTFQEIQALFQIRSNFLFELFNKGLLDKPYDEVIVAIEDVPTILNNPLETCGCLRGDNIDWWSCTLANIDVYDKPRAKGRLTQRLNAPCTIAMKQFYHNPLVQDYVKNYLMTQGPFSRRRNDNDQTYRDRQYRVKEITTKKISFPLLWFQCSMDLPVVIAEKLFKNKVTETITDDLMYAFYNYQSLAKGDEEDGD